MSRIDVLLVHPKRTLGVLALVLVAVGVAVGPGANFSASGANPSNTCTAGTLTMSNSNDAAAVLTASNWKPGDTQTGTVDIQNTGSLAHVRHAENGGGEIRTRVSGLYAKA